MSGVEFERSGRSARGEEQPIELRRHLDALRRGRTLIIALVVVMTALALGLSLLLAKKYDATATLVYNPTASAFAARSACRSGWRTIPARPRRSATPPRRARSRRAAIRRASSASSRR